MSRTTAIAVNGGAISVLARTSSLVIASLMMLSVFSTNAHATPMEADMCSVFESMVGDQFPCVQPGNDSGVGGEANVEAGILSRTGMAVDLMAVTADVINAPTDFMFFEPGTMMELAVPIDTLMTFDWKYTGPETLAYATLKAGPEFAIFYLGGATMGTLTTVDVLENGGGQTPEISHVVFWKEVQVPEPTTMVLLAAGLAGLGFASRRRKRSI